MASFPMTNSLKRNKKINCGLVVVLHDYTGSTLSWKNLALLPQGWWKISSERKFLEWQNF